jgi:hypothetical protein
MPGAGESGHGESMQERRQVTFRFVGRATRGDKKNVVKMKTPLCGMGDGQVAQMNRVESAAEKGNPPASHELP